MSFDMPCPSCGSAVRLADEHAGSEARCGRCGTVFVAFPAHGPDREADNLLRMADEADGWQPAPSRVAAPEASGMAVTALILGIVAILTWPCPPIGLVTGGLALILGGNSLGARSRASAVAGIVLGIAGGVFSLGCGVLWGAFIYQESQVSGIDPEGNRPPFVRDAD